MRQPTTLVVISVVVIIIIIQELSYRKQIAGQLRT